MMRTQKRFYAQVAMPADIEGSVIMSKRKVYQQLAKWDRKNLDGWEWENLHEVADALRAGLSETGAESAVEELFTNRYGEEYAHSPIGKRERATAVRFYLERR